ncbi:DMT family transporter [Oxalobacter vibrioformis]|uniref:DMT family transporter n=1 Tax=Oxalobacter vibrioformis TaxID=933080 RepID=A0A9E9P2F7_9BURK|nr:DMT family transporter [Oxalobacter vibrioformis]WAW08953.1 DMT family transporter [Oxalobacter vibrioformis]
MQSLWMVFAALLFSLMGVCVKLLSGIYTTPEIVMYRSLIGAIFMFFVVLARKGSFRTAFFWQHLWRGVVGVTAHGLWFYALVFLPLATAVTLNYMSPIWIAAFLFLIGIVKRKVGFEWRLVFSILTSFIGVALLLRPTIHADQWFAGLVGLVSGALAAMAYLQVRRLGELGEPEYRVVFYFCVIGSICAALACIVSAYLPGSDGVIWHSHDGYGFSLLAVIGVSAAIAQVAMTRAYHLGKTLVTANLQYTGIVFSSIWGILIWDDALGIIGWLGIAIIMGSGMTTTFFDVRHKMAATSATFQEAKKRLMQTSRTGPEKE